MAKRWAVCLGLGLWSLVGAAVYADSVAIVAGRDNTLYEEPAGALSNGAGEHFFAGRVGALGSGRIRRGLIWFDIAGTVPCDGTINAARLRLHMSKTVAGTLPVTIHLVRRDWGEGVSDALGDEGSGAPSTPGDATWIHTFYNTDLWVAAGGDFAPVPRASTDVGAIGYYFWGSTPEMVADVQSWLNDPANNFGWEVVGFEETTQTTKRFDTRENAVSDFWPVLFVDYTPFFLTCDLNCDGFVNNADIPLFVLALTDIEAWQDAVGPDCEILCVGDTNGDGSFNNADIPGFVDCLTK